MNIKLIVSNITSSAGTERAAINLANNLWKHGYSVTILSLYTIEGSPYFAMADGVIINHLNIKTSKYLVIRILLGFIKTLIGIYKNIAKSGDIVIGTNHVHNFTIAIIKKIKGNNKYIGCEHLSYTALTSYSKLLVRCLYRFLNVVVVLTDDDLVHFNRDVPKVLCVVIPNELSFYPEKTSTCTNKKLLAIGRYTFQKGFDLLIDLTARAFQQSSDWTLKIVGDGEMKKLLEKKINQYDLSNRILLVPPTKNVLDLYLESSIYLMTSRYEGLPMVLLEAKACGLPVIAYNCPTGPGALIKEDDGVLIDIDDSNSFVKSLLLLMGDTEKRRRLGENAHINSMQYSAEIIYKKWESLFNTL